MITGVDVASPYQDSWRPAAGEDFCFVKASQNTGYRNPEHAAQVKRARDSGLVVGHYHWLGTGSLAAQLANFAAVGDILPGDLIAVDWEQSGISGANKDAFLRLVKAKFPAAKVGLYCNTNYWLHVDTTSYCGDFLWIAWPSSNPPPIKTDWLIWQYSQTGGLDRNQAKFASRDVMKSWAAGTPVTPPTVPVVAPVTPIVTIGQDNMTSQPTMTRTAPQTVAPSKNGYQLLGLGTGSNVTWGWGAGSYELDLRLVFSGISADDELMVRVIWVDTDRSGTAVGNPHAELVQGLPGGSGSSFRSFHWRGDVPAPASGVTRRLRIEVANFSGKTITVSRVDVNSWKG